MDAKLFLAPPWTGVVLTPPCIDRNRTQSLHRVIFGDGLNLVHIWEKYNSHVLLILFSILLIKLKVNRRPRKQV